MAIQVEGPVGAATRAREPCHRRITQCSQEVLVHLSVPGEDLLRGARAPTLVDEAIAVRDAEPALLLRPALAAGRERHALFPVSDVCQHVFHGPRILSLGAGHALLPLRGR